VNGVLRLERPQEYVLTAIELGLCFFRGFVVTNCETALFRKGESRLRLFFVGLGWNKPSILDAILFGGTSTLFFFHGSNLKLKSAHVR
jgi:hypothetical protein